MRIPGLVLLAALCCAAAHAGTFELTTVDESGEPLPCRILVRGSDGRCAVPDGAVTLQTGQDQWFMSSGRSQVDIPEGDTTVRIERGTEYVRIKRQLRMNATAARTYTLRRWIDMRDKGYLCGENHLHVDSVQLAPMAVAEGLDFGTSLTWWRGPDPRRPVPEGTGRVRLLEFAGRKLPTSIHDAELEYAWGAAYIQNLPGPMPLAAEPGRPNLDYLRHATEAGAIVHYQGGWSREVLLDALLGYVHTVNVCNNNFALHRFQPRSRYSNLLEVPEFPIYPDTDVGMLAMNTDTYYRLLNCGLRLAAGGGSATGVKQAPVGYNRAYVRVAPDASLGEFNDAWKAGRNFVTNGPMLFLKTEAGQRPGDTIVLPKAGGTVTLLLEARSKLPLTTCEIIVNGEVAKELKFAGPIAGINSRIELPIAAGSWIAARCTARDTLLDDDELAAYKDANDDAPFRVAPSRLRFAHTSPIYVKVGGRRAAVRKSIIEGFQMLEQFEAFARKNADAPYHAGMTDAIQTARARLLDSADGKPGDEPPSYTVPRADTEITIDGRLDEDAWTAAPAVGEFAFPWWQAGTKEQTVAKLLWDDEMLYVAFRCDDAHVWAEQTERDSPVYKDDCVEVFTAPNAARPFNYFNIEMNVRGAFLDRHHPHGPGTPEVPNWNAQGVQIATTVDGTLNDDSDTDRAWVLEAAIPFANFAAAAKHTPPKLGDVWHLNLNRLGGKTNPQFSQWSPGRTERPQFHAPQFFGRVVFGPKKAAKKQSR